VICIAESLYYASVTTYGNPNGLLKLPGLEGSVLLSSLGGAIVQSIFGYKIYVFSGSKPIIPMICWILSVMRVAGGSTGTILLLHYPSIPAFLARFSWIFTFSMGTASATDILITVSLTYYFQERKADTSFE
jgi:hypothetical protein